MRRIDHGPNQLALWIRYELWTPTTTEGSRAPEQLTTNEVGRLGRLVKTIIDMIRRICPRDRLRIAAFDLALGH